MPEIGNIKVHKNNGKFYLNIIAYEDVAEKLEISDGLWTEFEITEELFNEFIKAIAQADYYKTKGHELDYMTTINGELFNDMSRLG